MIKTTVKIDGMMCGMCESHMNDKIRNSFKVKSVKSSHTKGESVILSETKLNEADLRAAIEEIGYTPLSVTTGEYEKKGLFGIFGR